LPRTPLQSPSSAQDRVIPPTIEKLRQLTDEGSEKRVGSLSDYWQCGRS